MNTQPDNEMVERVADAIFKRFPITTPGQSRELAQAAINAVMEWRDIETISNFYEGEFLAYDSVARKCDVCELVAFGSRKAVQPTQSDGEYGPCSDEFGYNEKNITHWMPLPPLPKQEGET